LFLLFFRFSQAISAPHPIAIIAQNQIYQESLASPRLAALQKELEAGHTAALENFWQEITKQETTEEKLNHLLDAIFGKKRPRGVRRKLPPLSAKLAKQDEEIRANRIKIL
jgi:hypothetical protein